MSFARFSFSEPLSFQHENRSQGGRGRGRGRGRQQQGSSCDDEDARAGAFCYPEQIPIPLYGSRPRAPPPPPSATSVPNIFSYQAPTPPPTAHVAPLTPSIPIQFPIRPFERAAQMEGLLMSSEGSRKYHRFRLNGGMSSAETVGCPLLCAYCFNYARNSHPEAAGELYSPQQVADRLLQIAQENRLHKFRVSGAEPILGHASLRHLLQVEQAIFARDPVAHLVVETNGLLLGYDSTLLQAFLDGQSRLRAEGHSGTLSVRVSIKGATPASFEKITGATASAFQYPVRALQALQKAGVDATPAVMCDIHTDHDLEDIHALLAIRSGLAYSLAAPTGAPPGFGGTSSGHQPAGPAARGPMDFVDRNGAPLEIERLDRIPFIMANLDARGVAVARPPAN
ncbi:putative radical SAM protein [Paratrimastix pyriformis]|uniref:Radical SAM protein n=1 Tax=Paratrimastix pyriformis TaxID=342808 RepID=A0ABQ8ULZ9_9EUKA|nr:putative radical SAM protein [Paratrimastix pyriformis]